MSNHHHFAHRDFLKLAGAGLGAAILACAKGVDLTAVPEASVTPLPPGTATDSMLAYVTPFPPGTTADTILTNGRIMTVDAADSIT
jgi:hypothetical protein